MNGFRPIEHTADLGLEIFGRNLKELFINGVRGIFYLINPSLKPFSELPISKEDIITLSDFGYEGLLVQWLNEFIFNFFVRTLIPVKVSIKELTSALLKSKVSFSDWTESNLPLTELKAATYHGLKMEKRGGFYFARVILDI